MKYITTTMFTLSLFIVSTGAMTNEPIVTLETGWLETEVGSTGNLLGAKVVDIENSPGSELTVIMLEVPVNNPENFERIEVIDKKTQQPIKQKGDAEWLENYEKGTSGLRLHLKKVPGFEFRLRLIDNENNKINNSYNSE